LRRGGGSALKPPNTRHILSAEGRGVIPVIPQSSRKQGQSLRFGCPPRQQPISEGLRSFKHNPIPGQRFGGIDRRGAKAGSARMLSRDLMTSSREMMSWATMTTWSSGNVYAIRFEAFLSGGKARARKSRMDRCVEKIDFKVNDAMWRIGAPRTLVGTFPHGG
jgi:hypothetical protein